VKNWLNSTAAITAFISIIRWKSVFTLMHSIGEFTTKVSFCTTCFNRVAQLRQTFEANAQVVASHPSVEWTIVNFNSVDDLDSYMREKLSIVSERIIYARDLSRRPWHLSYAKNIAHRISRSDILMNLDCDNFIGNAIDVIKVQFFGGCRLLHMWSKIQGDGTCGRIAVDRRVFHALGGYDESLHPMGYQDFDFIRRATAAGVPYIRCGCDANLAIKNTKQESIRHCSRPGFTWEDYNRENRARSMANIAAGRFVANAPHGWAPLNVEKFCGEMGAATGAL
jgi:hypothetical protein